MNVPFFLVGVGSGLGAGVISGAGREDSSKLSLVSSPSLFEGTGGNLLVGYGDLVFCADIQVSDGPLALGLTGIGLLFLGEGGVTVLLVLLPCTGFARYVTHSDYRFPGMGMSVVFTTW